LSLTAEQSVELFSHRKFEINVDSCQFEDKGRAIVDWLENGREQSDILKYYCLHGCDCHENILKFLGRSMYPVFDKLYLRGQDIGSRLTQLVATANVMTVMTSIDFFIKDYRHERAPLLCAFRDGTFRPRSISISFAPGNHSFRATEIDEVREFMAGFLEALSSPDCSLKELHLRAFNLTDIALDLKKNVVEMLQKNKSLRVLGVYSTVSRLQFPQMSILNAAAAHPRLRKLCFYPPTRNPPKPGQTGPFPMWAQKNRSHDIQFIDKEELSNRRRLRKWRKAVFAIIMKDFDAITKVEDERIRSHLLATTLGNFHQKPDRVYHLLCGNQDLLARYC
jgi:hypothetical protein